jgi:hypothetical protein
VTRFLEYDSIIAVDLELDSSSMLNTTNFSSFATLRPFWNGRKVFGTSKMSGKVFKSSSLFRFRSLLLNFYCVFVRKEVLLRSKKPFGPFWTGQKTFLLFPNGPIFPIRCK